MKTLIRIVTMLLIFPAAHAAEGMWQPHQLPQLSGELKKLGLKAAPKSLNDLVGHPMNAIVGLGHCSASFVSPEGLAVTNHHCVQRILQHNSTTDDNLIEDGYLAEEKSSELSGGPGQRILVTVQATDVSKSMLDGLAADMDGLERQKSLEAHEKELVAACESEDGYRCEVHSFYEGLSFYLIKQLEIRDVRLVYAPPRGIGDYGGDVDNWMWPRHTGDYSFIRGYVSPQGQPADFSVDNVPYRPEHYLTVSTGGIRDGDFAMALGYPGRTYRHRLAAEASEIGGWFYPLRQKLYEDMLKIIGRETAERDAAAIKYSSLLDGLNNVIKNYGGMIEGFARSGLVERKKGNEREFARWLEKQAGGSQGLDDLNTLISEYGANRERRMIYRDFLRR
ncbi:MAG: S46 family peptidase, partial [Gammaproteobacteria bacterium]|nr:S46 family peptidase [Gammaproteobacteria bacterium]